MAQCKVSIIMPVYNVSRYLRNCMDSIVAQTMKDIELIVVNDGSTDDSLSILKEYEAQYKEWIHVFTTENRGVSHARNYGIDRASGEYLLFVDSDDFVEPEICEKLYEKAERDNNDVVICRYNDVYENAEKQTLTIKQGKAYEIVIGRNFDIHDTKFELTHISPFPWDKLYRRSLFETLRFPEKLRFEDLAIMYCLMTKAKSIGVIEDRLYNYRRASEGSFLSNFSEGTLDIVTALQLFVKQMKEQGNYEEFKEEIEYICTRHLLIRYNAIFDTATKGKLAIKKEMIHNCMDFLEKNFPNWRENRYLLYTASGAARAKMKKYTSRGKMLRTATIREYTPMFYVKIMRKVKKIQDKIKGKWKKFSKAKNKVRFIYNRIPGIKLLHLPNDVRYTMYYEKCSVNEKDVLFESKHGDDIAGNIFMMLQAMGDEKYSDFHIMLTLKEDNISTYSALLARYGIDYVDIITTDSKEYLKVLATTKYLITDTSFPPYFIKRPEQVYLNTWHGTPLKAMGRIVPKREYALGNVQRNFYLADYLLYQNQFSRDIFIEDYMLAPLFNGKVMLSGYPRNSAFFNTERYDAIRSELGIEDMQVMAYMPTWRGLLNKKENKKQITELVNYFYELDMLLRDDQVLYVKLHPFVKSAMNYDDFTHIVPFPEEYETYDFLNATDLLITDYSSIMFDYAVSKKKIILFTYDREEYLNDRGMYLDLNEVEFPIADTVEQLAEEMKKDSSYPKFHQEFCSLDSADTAEKVCETLFLQKEPNFSLKPIEREKKKKVLILISGLKNNASSEQLMDRLNELDTNKYDIYLCAKASTIRKATSLLARLKDEINYLPLMFDVNYTIKDRIACLKSFKFGFSSKRTESLIRQLAEREKKKYFGDINFDIVINLSSLDKILFHMCKSFEGEKVFNLKAFDYDKYTENKDYRKFIDYFLKRIDGYSCVASTDQILKVDQSVFEQNQVKLWLNEDPKLDLPELLKEVDK